MSTAANLLVDFYDGLYTKADPRLKGYPFMDSPRWPIGIAAVYLLVIYFGPKLMKNRPAVILDKQLIWYNSFQMFMNLILFVMCLIMEVPRLNWFCAPIDFADRPEYKIRMLGFYTYFLLKLLDLLDTLFFILRKKNAQITFLHVFHHFGMIFIGWCAANYWAGGHTIYTGVGNTFVHIVVYFYYLLSIWKPEYKQSTWWKKQITHIQLIQFLFFIITYGQVLLKPKCNFPKYIAAISVTENVSLFVLFSNFYYQTYIKKKKAKRN